MADLPEDRLEAVPHFTSVGLDVFGPWYVQTRKTKGGSANFKRWVVIFVCLSLRAIPMEVISMNTSSFICALRRFLAIRGPVARIRCDRGSNFVGAKLDLDESLRALSHDRIGKYLTDNQCEWLFNPPHASHFGRVREGQIGSGR